MSVPNKIRIYRERGYRTDQIGVFGNGNQFMAFVTATFPAPLPKNWQEHKRWYAVLHTFSSSGKHLGTEAWFSGVTASGESGVIKKAEAKLTSLISELGRVRYQDVEIFLFQVKIDGHKFGLVDASAPSEGYESIHLLPNDLAFFFPWDGSYST